jgi:hypothetical protein
LDELLARALSSDPDLPADNGFSAAVVGRILRRQRFRRGLLGGAALAGTLIALAPAWDLIAAAGLGVATLVAQSSAVNIPQAYGQAAPAAALALLALLFARVLEG